MRDIIFTDADKTSKSYAETRVYGSKELLNIQGNLQMNILFVFNVRAFDH